MCVCVVGWFYETGRGIPRFFDIFSGSVSRKSGSSAGGRVSSSYEVNSLPRAESTTTSGNSSSARASRRRSSRPSVGGSRGNTSEGESFHDSRRPSASQTQPRGGRSTSKKGAPSSAQTLSRGGRSRSQETETETDPPSETVPGPSVSGSTPAGGSVSKRRLGSATPAGSRSSRAKKRVSSSASGVSQDVTELSSKRRLELSLQQSAGSPRRLSSRSTPSAYRVSAPSARQPVTEAGEVETDGEPALLLANSSDEEDTEKTSRSVTPKISINHSINQDQSVIS